MENSLRVIDIQMIARNARISFLIVSKWKALRAKRDPNQMTTPIMYATSILTERDAEGILFQWNIFRYIRHSIIRAKVRTTRPCLKSNCFSYAKYRVIIEIINLSTPFTICILSYSRV
jgi:hypothetical protein